MSDFDVIATVVGFIVKVILVIIFFAWLSEIRADLKSIDQKMDKFLKRVVEPAANPKSQESKAEPQEQLEPFKL